MDPELTEEEAWYYFQEACDDLRAVLRKRDMNFDVKWVMTARPRKTKKRASTNDAAD